jgi:hypothetical protein
MCDSVCHVYSLITAAHNSETFVRLILPPPDASLLSVVGRASRKLIKKRKVLELSWLSPHDSYFDSLQWDVGGVLSKQAQERNQTRLEPGGKSNV